MQEPAILNDNIENFVTERDLDRLINFVEDRSALPEDLTQKLALLIREVRDEKITNYAYIPSEKIKNILAQLIEALEDIEKSFSRADTVHVFTGCPAVLGTCASLIAEIMCSVATCTLSSAIIGPFYCLCAFGKLEAHKAHQKIR